MCIENSQTKTEPVSVMNVKYPLEPVPYVEKVYIYGTGTSGTAFYAWLIKCRPDVVVAGFIDSYHSGKHLELPVYSLSDFVALIDSSAYDEILILSHAHQAIEKHIRHYLLDKYRIISPPIYLLANILHNPKDDESDYQALMNSFSSDKESYGDLHLFFGENMGKFVGNNKYFYLYLNQLFPGKVFWVTEISETFYLLREHGLPVIDAKTDDFNDWLGRASHFYFDKMSWPRAYPWLRYFKAKKIHTSHGVGLKYTEQMTIPDDFLGMLNNKEKKWLNDNILKNDLLLSTSLFYAKKVSEPGYGTPLNKISFAGYPKNDVLYHKIKDESLFTDQPVIQLVKEKKQQGYKVICYTPTCRHMDASHQDRQILELHQINQFCKKINAVFVIKGHGLTEIPDEQLADFSHVYEYNNECDIYPLLRDTDLLITDYSSIYIDFLHVRKPILFFPYDLDEYTKQHCPLQFDYQKMTPGPKAHNWVELKYWLTYFLVENKDEFLFQRQNIFALAYTSKTVGASERLLCEMKTMNLLSVNEPDI